MEKRNDQKFAGKPGPGRPPGVQNRLTRELKAMIEGALDDLGGQAWLVECAQREPAAFLTLIGKLLPKDINLSGELQVTSLSDEELEKEIAELCAKLGYVKLVEIGLS